MTRRKHTILATIPVGDPDIGAECEALITFTFLKGAPEQGPSYSSGGQPADPDEIEFVKAEPYCNGKPSPYYGAFADMEMASLQDIAANWLESDEGYAAAEQKAWDDDIDERDRADEDRHDRMREEGW